MNLKLFKSQGLLHANKGEEQIGETLECMIIYISKTFLRIALFASDKELLKYIKDSYDNVVLIS